MHGVTALGNLSFPGLEGRRYSKSSLGSLVAFAWPSHFAPRLEARQCFVGDEQAILIVMPRS